MRGSFRYTVLLFCDLLWSLNSVCLGANTTSPIGKQQVQWCSDSAGMCVAMNIPSDFSTDYYISMTAPQSIGWAAFGIGSNMLGSLMFIIAANNGNVTLSVRVASDYTQPVEVKNSSATLVEGTGVNNSFITANIHVANGFHWNGGNLDRTSTSQDFIYAFSPKKPSSASDDLVQHVVVGNFQMDMTTAIGAGGIPAVVSPSTSWGWSTTVLAHAVIMGLAWIGGLLSGAVIIRFLDKRFKDPAYVHQYLQLASFAFVFIAFFIGVGASKGQHLKFGHQWLGLILFLGLMIQGGLGYYHHRRFVADKPTSRRWFTKVHLWFGRLLIFLALINMGLGMQLYGDPAGAQAGWYLIVIAAIAAYAFFYWRNFFRYRRHDAESFDPSKLEDPLKDDAASLNDAYRPVNTVTPGNDGDLDSFKLEQYDPEISGVNEYGARIKNARPVAEPTVTAIGLPTQAASSSTSGRRYDLSSTPVIPGPYGPTEPLRTGQILNIPEPAPAPPINPPQQDPFSDPNPRPRTGIRPMTGARPMTGFRQPGPRPQTGVRPQTGRPNTGAPYGISMTTPASMESIDEDVAPSLSAYNTPPHTAQSYASAQSAQSTQSYASAQTTHLAPPSNVPTYSAPAPAQSSQQNSNSQYTHPQYQQYQTQQYTNEQYANQHSSQQYSNSQYAGQQYSQQHSNSQYTHPQYSNQQYANQQYATPQYDPRQYPQG